MGCSGCASFEKVASEHRLTGGEGAMDLEVGWGGKKQLIYLGNK